MKKASKIKNDFINHVSDIDNKKEPYFWPANLHQEFMRQFSIYGKTWKIVS